MLRGTNDSCSLLRHTLSEHSHPERQTCHNVSFIPPVWHQAWICHDITLRLCVSYCRLFFISSPPVDLSLDLAVSGYVCVCLSTCSSVLLTFFWKGCYCLEMHWLSRQWEEIAPPPQQTFKTILGLHTDTQHTAYDGWCRGENHLKWILTTSDLYWRNILNLQGLPPDLRLCLPRWRIKAWIKEFRRANEKWAAKQWWTVCEIHVDTAVDSVLWLHLLVVYHEMPRVVSSTGKSPDYCWSTNWTRVRVVDREVNKHEVM